MALADPDGLIAKIVLSLGKDEQLDLGEVMAVYGDPDTIVIKETSEVVYFFVVDLIYLADSMSVSAAIYGRNNRLVVTSDTRISTIVLFAPERHDPLQFGKPLEWEGYTTYVYSP